MPAAQHHLFWLHPDKQIFYYGQGADVDTALQRKGLNLCSLMTQRPELRATLELQLQKSPVRLKKKSPPIVKVTRRALGDVMDGKQVSRNAARQIMLMALAHAPQSILKQVIAHQEAFSAFMTPHYKQLLPLIDLDLAPRSGLLLHKAEPHVYLWLPADYRPTKKLIVCFLTINKTLNASLPLAHTKLASLGMPILYAYGEKKRHPAAGLVEGWNHVASAGVIRALAKRFGFEDLYGIGTSLGGYAACHYAEALDFKRVLNFSGSAGRLESDDPHAVSPDAWAKGYDKSRIMSVLARDDVTDQRICAMYDRFGFETPRLLLDSDKHGTFTTAWIQGLLPDLFDWLLTGQGLHFGEAQ